MSECPKMMELLARWQAFSLLQQRAFAFLASEALASGQEFENSTEGASRILTHLAGGGRGADVQSDIWSVVHRLQTADRSRQGLEQVASVLTTLTRQHHDLVTETLAVAAALPEAEGAVEAWIAAMSGDVSLTDWRRRLDDALHGREPSAAAPVCDDELF